MKIIKILAIKTYSLIGIYEADKQIMNRIRKKLKY
jgi:hypothetical protein